MSTRISIIYDFGIHLYEEVMSREVCLAGEWSEYDAKNYRTSINNGYCDIVVPREKLVEWRDSLNEYLAETTPTGSVPG